MMPAGMSQIVRHRARGVNVPPLSRAGPTCRRTPRGGFEPESRVTRTTWRGRRDEDESIDRLAGTRQLIDPSGAGRPGRRPRRSPRTDPFPGYRWGLLTAAIEKPVISVAQTCDAPADQLSHPFSPHPGNAFSLAGRLATVNCPAPLRRALTCEYLFRRVGRCNSIAGTAVAIAKASKT
jgi:hypothetical protein